MFERHDKLPHELGHISQAEVQDASLRLQGRLSARMKEAFAALASTEDAALRLRARRDHLDYQATPLDIAIGPLPESNLLDMVAFVELATEACRSRWNADVHGERGAAVTAAFQAGSADAWRTARMLLTPQQEEQLRRIIREWRDENPHLSSIATVRLPALSEITGDGASRAEVAAHGLFRDVRKGIQAADMTRLLGERALFAAQRMPFLARLQATIAVSEIVREIAGELPARAADIAGAAAERLEGYVFRAIVTGALAAAGVVVVAAVAYASVR